MNWLSGLLAAVQSFFKWKTQADDPEVIRKKKISELDKEIEAWKEKRDRILHDIRDDSNAEQRAMDLGIVTDNLIRLRRARTALER